MSAKGEGDKKVPAARKQGEVDAFLRQVAAMPAARPAAGRGRLIFAMDATASREPSWDRACRIQGEMFEATAASGRPRRCNWSSIAASTNARRAGGSPIRASLHRAMRAVFCVGGETQIARVLRHALDRGEGRTGQRAGLRRRRDGGIARRADRAGGRAGLLGVPVFLFHEGGNPWPRAPSRRSRG